MCLARSGKFFLFIFSLARSGKWVGKMICIEEEFLCDNTLQCLGGEDERDCAALYLKRKIFRPSETFVCKKSFLKIGNFGKSSFAATDISSRKTTASSPANSELEAQSEEYEDIFGSYGVGNYDEVTSDSDSNSDYIYDYGDEADIFGDKKRRKRETLRMNNDDVKVGETFRKFFPYRGVACDGARQCPHGEDEEHCEIEEFTLVFLGKGNPRMFFFFCITIKCMSC